MTEHLNVVIDGRALVGERTGIGVHTAEIASRLPFEPRPLIATHASILDQTSIEQLRFDVSSAPFGVYWQQMRLAAVAERERADVIWGPHGTLPLTTRTPAVVSLHDLTSITMVHRHRLRTVLSFNAFIGASLERAAAIAAVSRSTADEIIRGFSVPPRKIEIVPNGVDPFFAPAHPGEIDPLPPELPPRSYILYVGTLEPRKGVLELLAAWREMQHRPTLVLCGGWGWRTGAIRKAVERLPEVIVTGFVSRENLRALYRDAALFVYPSHHEGFGLPVLEAMACGTPVVTTSGGALGELATGAAVIVDPYDASAFARAMSRLLGDEPRRAELVSLGFERAAMYTWDRSAALMAELMRKAAHT